jgi:hypothetical protein
MNGKYILDGHKPKLELNLIKWSKWLESADRCVKKTKVNDIDVSTVFLGLDHSFGVGEPLLFETLVFGGSLDGEMDRYSTWEAAEIGHNKMVEKVRRQIER